MNKKEKGNEGEDIACEYLKKRNYCIFRRNFYFHGGEIDVIAKDKSSDEIVFLKLKHAQASSMVGGLKRLIMLN